MGKLCGRVRKNAAQVRAVKKKEKRAEKKVKLVNADCSKLKKANANIGKAFNKLKRQMKNWSRKNKWLKQKKRRRSSRRRKSKKKSLRNWAMMTQVHMTMMTIWGH